MSVAWIGLCFSIFPFAVTTLIIKSTSVNWIPLPIWVSYSIFMQLPGINQTLPLSAVEKCHRVSFAVPSLVRSYKFIWYLFTVLYKSRPFRLAFKIDTYIRCKGWEVRETRVYCWPLTRVRNDQKAKRFTLILKTDITRTIGEQSSIHRTLPFIIDHWFTSTCVKSQNALCKLTRTLNPTLACKKSKVCVQVQVPFGV